MRQSRTVNKVQKSRSRSVLDRVEKLLREPCIANEQHSKILSWFWKVLQMRCGNIPVYCDQEECLREVVHSTAGRLGLPTRVTAVGQSQANGRAAQRVRALRQRLQFMVQDARRRGVEIILGHPVAQWAMRHAGWIQNFFVKSDVLVPSNVVGFSLSLNNGANRLRWDINALPGPGYEASLMRMPRNPYRDNRASCSLTFTWACCRHTCILHRLHRSGLPYGLNEALWNPCGASRSACELGTDPLYCDMPSMATRSAGGADNPRLPLSCFLGLELHNLSPEACRNPTR